MLLDHKHDFSDFAGWSYLNCAFHGPLPRVARRALEAVAELRENPEWMRNEYHFTLPDAYRRAVADLIHCDPSEVAITDSTTHGMMLLVRGLDWQAGDQIVIPAHEFPANKLPWLALEASGVEVRQVDLGGDGADSLELLAAAITDRTRLVSLAWVTFLNGRRLDLEPISRLCRDRGLLFAVDASQGIGGLPFDLRRTPADLVACSGYKWLLGPYGLGFAFVAPELADRLRPSNVNWFSAEGAEDFNRLADLPYSFRPGAHRFDLNETANFFNLAPGIASLRYLQAIGPAAIERHCRALNERLIAGLPTGFRPLGTEDPAARSNILCIAGEDAAATAAGFRRLRAHRVHISSRESSIRVSPHVYNDATDIDRFLEALRAPESSADPTPESARPSIEDRLHELLGLGARPNGVSAPDDN